MNEPKDVKGSDFEGLNFGRALFFLKQGRRICRKGWNGKGMFLELQGAEHYTHKIVNGVGLEIQPYICMKTAQNTWQPGWLASQADMLAEDWMIVTEDQICLKELKVSEKGRKKILNHIKELCESVEGD